MSNLEHKITRLIKKYKANTLETSAFRTSHIDMMLIYNWWKIWNNDD